MKPSPTRLYTKLSRTYQSYLKMANMKRSFVISRRSRVLLTLVAVGFEMTGLPAGRAQTPSPLPLPNPYRIDETFKLEMPPGLQSLGAVSGLKVGPDNNLYVFDRCVENSCTGHNDVPPILVYMQQGKLLRSLGAGMFVWPHGIAVMPDLSLWTTDAVGPNGVDKNNS